MSKDLPERAMADNRLSLIGTNEPMTNFSSS